MTESKYMQLSPAERAKKIAYQQEYNQKHVDKYIDYYKDYYKKNRDKLLAERQEKLTCICGKQVSRSSMSQHVKTTLHEKNLNQLVKTLLELQTCVEADGLENRNDESSDNSTTKKRKRTYDEKSKQCTYTWRENNRERYKEIGRKGQAKYYEENKEKIRKYNLARYYAKKNKEAQIVSESHVTCDM